MNFESKLDDPYLDLMKKCLTRYSFPDKYRPLHRPSRAGHPSAHFLYPLLHPLVAWTLSKFGFVLCRDAKFDPVRRAEGRDWPPEAETMMGLKRLDNVHYCIEQVIRDEIPGDFIETGVWRGGGCIFMRAALKAYAEKERLVWVADSFQGLPKPDSRFKQDEGDKFWTMNHMLGVSVEQVKSNFSRYGLLDDRVRFLKGWFKDTLPGAPIDKLAMLRLDGDMYSSTMDALVNLYPKLSAGGFVIIDDYGANFDACCNAVNDFRSSNRINDPLIPIDWTGVYWRKQA